MKTSSISGINREFSELEVTDKVFAIKEHAKENITADNMKLAFSCIDLTTLNATDTPVRGAQFAQNVNRFAQQYNELPNVAAICVYPNLVGVVRENLAVPGVHIASVSAGFPASMTFTEVKVLETEMAVKCGADEIDVVIALGDFLHGNEQFVYEELKRLKAACGTAHLKVILESGTLDKPELIWRASLIAMHAGADFIKTSTGKTAPAATLEAAVVMCEAIKMFHVETGRKVGFKPAGGISEASEAVEFLTVVESILGEEWMNNKLFRIGASRLANNLISELIGEKLQLF